MSKRGKQLNRLGNTSVAIPARESISEHRDGHRAEVRQKNIPNCEIPNPSPASFDRMRPQADKVVALGLAPNYPASFRDLKKGDTGAGSSVFRRTEIYQLLSGSGGAVRVAETPYNRAIGLATMGSTDCRPRYYHVSLFGTGLVLPRVAPTPPDPISFVETFTAGIPPSFAPIAASLMVPLVSTTKFRVLIQDESGGRYFDVDVIGTRSFNMYAFSVTVFVLVKDIGFEIDRQVDPVPLGPGMTEQAIVGSRIIPLRRNDTKNTDTRTIGVDHPGAGTSFNVPIPPGSRKVQIYSVDGVGPLAVYGFSFRTGSVVSVDLSNTSVGTISFNPGQSKTSIIDIPNANVIQITSAPGAAAALFNFAFEVTS